MKNIFFSSDLHLGHGNIIKYSNRPFLTEIDKVALSKNGGIWHNGEWKGQHASQWRISKEAIELMDDTLINNINYLVKEDDDFWLLGDFCFAPKNCYYNAAKHYRDRINCKNIFLVFGNHDERGLRDFFSQSYDLKMITLPNQSGRAVLCHYALSIWEGSHRGNIHLYGHSHSEAEIHLDAKFPGRRSMDVGVDNAAKLLGKYRPFSLDEIQNIMSTRKGHNLGDHHINPNTPTEEHLAE